MSVFASIWRKLNAPVTDWSGRKVWIIGASSGIGAALASAMLEQGARVAISARRVSMLEGIAQDYEHALVVPLDVLDERSWDQALERIDREFGEIDLVVFGAALYDPRHVWDLDLQKVQASYDLNVVCAYRAAARLAPRLIAQGHGGIAMIGSISGYTGLPRAIIYGATKAALQNLTETLYLELAPKGVSVYLISPGFVKTPMTQANDFEMPGLMTPQAAAQAILKGFARGLFEIRFPTGFANVLRLVSRLPYRIRFALLNRVTRA